MESFGSVCKLPRKPSERCVSQGFKDEILLENIQLRVLHSTCRATHQFIKRYDSNKSYSSPFWSKQRGIVVTNVLGIDLNGTLHREEEAVEPFKDMLAMENIPETPDMENMLDTLGMENLSVTRGTEEGTENLTQRGYMLNVGKSISEMGNLQIAMENMSQARHMESISQTGDVLNFVDSILKTKDLQKETANASHAEDQKSVRENISQTEDMGKSEDIISQPGNMKNDVNNIAKTGDTEGAMKNISQSEDMKSSIDTTAQSGHIENAVESVSQLGHSTLVNILIDPLPAKNDMASSPQTGQPQHVCEYLDANNTMMHLSAMESISHIGHALESYVATHIDSLSMECEMQNIPPTDRGTLKDPSLMGNAQHVLLLSSFSMNNAIESSVQAGKPHLISPVHSFPVAHAIETITQTGELRQSSLLDPLSTEKDMETVPQTGEAEQVSFIDSLSMKVLRESLTQAGESQQVSFLNSSSMKLDMETIPQTGESQLLSPIDSPAVEQFMKVINKARESQQVSITVPSSMESAMQTIPQTGELQQAGDQQVSIMSPLSMQDTMEIIPQSGKYQHVSLLDLNTVCDDLLLFSDDVSLIPEAPATPDLCSEDRSWSCCSSTTSPSFSEREGEEHGKVNLEEYEKERRRALIAACVNQNDEIGNEEGCQREVNNKGEEQERMLTEEDMRHYVIASLLHKEIASPKEIEKNPKRETKEMSHMPMKENESNDACEHNALQYVNQKRLMNHTVYKIVYFSKVIDLNISTTIRNTGLTWKAKYISWLNFVLKKLLRIVKTTRYHNLWKRSCTKLQAYLEQGKKMSTGVQIICSLCDLQGLIPRKIISAKKEQRWTKHICKKVICKRRIFMLYLQRWKYLARRNRFSSKVCGDGKPASQTEDNKSPVKIPECMTNNNDSCLGIECFENQPEQWKNEKQSFNKIPEEEWNSIQIDDLEECLDTCLQELRPLPLSFPAVVLSPYCKVVLKKGDMLNSKLSNSDLNNRKHAENLLLLNGLEVDTHLKLFHGNQVDAIRFASHGQGKINCSCSLSSSSQSGDNSVSLSSTQASLVQGLLQTCCSSTRSKQALSPPSPNASNLGTEFTKRMNKMKNKEKLKQCAEVFLLRRHIVQQQRKAQLAPPYPLPCSVGNVKCTPARRSIVDVDNAYYVEHRNLQERCYQTSVELCGSCEGSDMVSLVVGANKYHIKHANHQEINCSDIVIDIEELQKYVDVQLISQRGACREDAKNVIGCSGSLIASNQSLVIPNMATVIITIVTLVVYTRILCYKALARVGLRSRSKERN